MASSRTLGNWRLLAGILVLSSGVSATVFAARRLLSAGLQPNGSIVVPTGQTLTPRGVHIEVDDRPLGLVLSPTGAELAVVTGSNFNPRALHIIDTASKTLKAGTSSSD